MHYLQGPRQEGRKAIEWLKNTNRASINPISLAKAPIVLSLCMRRRRPLQSNVGLCDRWAAVPTGAELHRGVSCSVFGAEGSRFSYVWFCRGTFFVLPVNRMSVSQCRKVLPWTLQHLDMTLAFAALCPWAGLFKLGCTSWFQFLGFALRESHP